MLVIIFFIIALTLIIFFAIYSCNIRISINVSNNGYKVIMFVYVFGKICVFKSDIYNIVKKSKKKHFKLVQLKGKVIWIIRRLNIRAEELNLKIYVNTTEVQSTAIISGVLNSFISILILLLNIDINKNKFDYKVIPIYSNQKELNIKIKCIIYLRLVHIISTFNRSIKDWRRENYGR